MIVILVLAVVAVIIWSCESPPPSVQVLGPLSTNDVQQIIQVVLRERSQVSGELAPKDAPSWERRLRERVAGRIRRITSKNGKTANVDFGDRWDSKRGYDYDVERTTNGWKVIGVGSYGR